MDREGEGQLQLQQSIEAVAYELIRVTHVTAPSLHRLAPYGENHKEFVESAWTTWTAAVERPLGEHEQRAKQEQVAEI
eukprot:12900378-Prorocentrum_lima.AAC.1